MDPAATRSVPYQSFIQFRQCTQASQLIAWHKQYTPWMFLLRGNDKCEEVQKQLYSVYQKEFQQIQKKQQDGISQMVDEIMNDFKEQ